MKKQILLFLCLTISGFVNGAIYNIVSPILCNGDSASVEIIGTTGFPPYTNVGIMQFAAGTHIIYVTDSVGTVDTVEFNLTQPSPVSVNAVVLMGNLLCHQDSAIVSIEKFGGVGFNIIVDTIKVPGGMQVITVNDTNNCAGSTTVFISQPPLLEANVFIVQPILCNGDTAEISIGATGGTPPFTGNTNFNYVAGTYTHMVSDANNCKDTIDVNIIQPAPLTAQVSTTPDNGSNSGTASFVINGGTAPYLLFVDSVLKFSPNLTGLAYGNYNYYLLDSNQCLISGPLTINLLYPTPIANFAGQILNTIIYPNPITNGMAQIGLPINVNANNYEVLIYDGVGHTMDKKYYKLSKVNDNLLQMECKLLPKGNYILSFKTDNGKTFSHFSVH